MKKSIKVRVICLIVAAVVLSGAVAAAAVMGSPYDTLKRALLDALTYRNVTEETHASILVNGVPIEESRAHNILGDDSSISYVFGTDGNITGYYYRSNGLYVYPEFISLKNGVDTQWLRADVNPYRRYNSYSGGGLAMFSREDRNSAKMRFFELLADALIGDLKNNITMTSENGIRYVQGTLTGSQVPELAKAGIDALIEQSNGRYFGDTHYVSFDGEEYVYERISIERGMKTVATWKQSVRSMTPDEQESWFNGTFFDNIQNSMFWGTTNINGNEYIVTAEDTLVDEYTVPATRTDYGYISNPLELPMKSLVIDYIHGEAEIDADGNLLYIDLSGTVTVTSIFGDANTTDLKYTARFSDIGTSNPSCPIPGAEELLTPKYMKTNFGSENISVYFTLNSDGSINASSITTTYPGEIGDREQIKFSYDMPGYPASPPVPPQLEVSTVVENHDVGDVADVTGVGDVGDAADIADVGDVANAGDVADVGDVADAGDIADVGDVYEG